MFSADDATSPHSQVSRDDPDRLRTPCALRVRDHSGFGSFARRNRAAGDDRGFRFVVAGACHGSPGRIILGPG
jgi:hypothetical protein